jgi:hypothetical protein
MIDAAVTSVDDSDGGPAREECDSQKQRYGDRSGADIACDFRFHKAFVLPFPSENFYRRCKNSLEPEFFCRGFMRITRDRDTIRDREETVEQHRVCHLVARAAVH